MNTLICCFSVFKCNSNVALLSIDKKNKSILRCNKNENPYSILFVHVESLRINVKPQGIDTVCPWITHYNKQLRRIQMK